MQAFIAAAERQELASNIDRQVIPALLGTISGTGDRHILNISANSVKDFSFAGWFQRQLQSQDVEGRQVVLQFSADAALQDLRATRRMIEEIAPTGCTFSVSGVHGGRQHESLPEQLDLAFVKLDSQFTRSLKDQPQDLQTLRNLVSIAAGAGTHVLADQVNDSVDMAMLWQCGVRHLAGDFLLESSRFTG
jgi:EAL domain-containing protein (putative c-di-GMP-specific phosphodiesterase class I)